MAGGVTKTIGICAPSRAITRDMADQVTVYAAQHFPHVALYFHEQCFAVHGHFAGTDAQRAAAFIELANDPALDAVWFARGGYGAARIADAVLQGLGPAAGGKIYLGYSDGGNMLAALYASSIGAPCHGPMVADIARAGGKAAIHRALDWLTAGDAAALEPGLSQTNPNIALNLMTLSMLTGWKHCPDLSGHVLLIEEVDEHLYALDRMMFHLTNNVAGDLAGIRLGRVSAVPTNDIAFGMSAENIVRFWCDQSAIPYLGRADIGHDADNKVVPFGRL